MAESKTNKRLVVIDGKSVFYRGYYAMPNLAAKDGTPTGGVFGFATMALEVIRQLKPDYVCVAWDKPKTNIRRRLELYPAYKAGRKPAPADFYDQVPLLHQLLQAFGWPLYELDDYEADDIMGTLACQATAQGIETMLVTSDLDLLQVVDEHVHVFALKKGLSNIELYSPKSFEAKYGLQVNQFLDMKSLKGDSSDNIPGVPGIGEKGAIELLKTYGTLDNIYDNLPLIKDSLRKKLELGRESAYLSKQLASIWTDAPLPLDLKAMDGSKCQPEQVLDLFNKFEFKSLARRLPDVMQVAIADYHQANGHTEIKPGQCRLIDADNKLDELKLAADAPLVVIGRAAGARGARPERLVVSDAATTVYLLDLTKLDGDKVVALLAGRQLIGYNLKQTLELLAGLGARQLPAVKHDVMIAAFLLNALIREQTLSELAASELGYEAALEDGDLTDFDTRAAEMAAIIRQLHEKQSAALAELPRVQHLAETVEWPIIPVLARMELAGMELDTEYLKDFAEEVDGLVSDLEQQIYGLANEEFTIGSPQQLSRVLFETLGLPTQGIKRGKTGYSTAAGELDKLRGQHAIIDAITAWREVTKLKNTYIDTLPKLVDDQSRLHTTFNLTIAQTGRLSSTNPNLQNIPVRTKLGRRIRTAFVAGEGNKLVSADYSQFELRLAAVMSGDQELIDMFNQGADIHTLTAAQVYGRQPEEVSKQMRYAAKAVNFGILYGQGPHGLAQQTGMTHEQAVRFISTYKKLRQPLFDYMERTKQFARDEGYVETLLGRRRPTPDIHSSNFVVRSAAERAAINMPIQGTEADIMKLAMIKIDQELREQHNDCQLLLQIHDSVVVECPAPVAKDIAKLITDAMDSAYDLPVRLQAEATIGDNWGEL